MSAENPQNQPEKDPSKRRKVAKAAGTLALIGISLLGAKKVYDNYESLATPETTTYSAELTRPQRAELDNAAEWSARHLLNSRLASNVKAKVQNGELVISGTDSVSVRRSNALEITFDTDQPDNTKVPASDLLDQDLHLKEFKLNNHYAVTVEESQNGKDSPTVTVVAPSYIRSENVDGPPSAPEAALIVAYGIRGDLAGEGYISNNAEANNPEN